MGSLVIVVATNNGSKQLPRLLKSFEKHGTGGLPVCIVDTGSSDPEFLDYLASLRSSGYLVERTPYGGYDTGAYIWGYKNYLAKEYVFMQDSMEILNSNWVDCFREKRVDVCFYAYFHIEYPNGFDEPAQLEFIKEAGILNEKTEFCAFGPIFYATRLAMATMESRYKFDRIIPKNKLQQQGMERGWAMMVDSCGLSRTWLGDTSTLRIGVFENIFHPSIKKYRPVRS